MVCVEKSTPGTTRWQTRCDERFLNPAGVVQGGFLAAMMDSAMGASAVTAARDRKVAVANTEMKISFIRPVRAGDELTCVATVLKPGRTITFVEAKIFDDNGLVIATASSTYLLKERTE
jgi:uncharacterized protein (TIGR00369 family)